MKRKFLEVAGGTGASSAGPHAFVTKHARLDNTVPLLEVEEQGKAKVLINLPTKFRSIMDPKSTGPSSPF